MQKQIKRVCVALSFPALFFSCSSLEIEDVPGGGPDGTAGDVPLNVLMNVSGPATKAIFEEVGTAGANKVASIGVLVARGAAGAYESYTVLPTDSYKTFAVAIAPKEGETGKNDTTWTAASKSIYLNNNEGMVYGWAPVGSDNPAITQAAITVAGVKVGAEQTFDAATNRWECSQADYLYGTDADGAHQTVSKKAPKASLYMRHALAKVSFKIMKGENDPDPDTKDYVKKIELTSASSHFMTGDAMTMSLVDGVLTSGTTGTALLFAATASKALQAAKYVKDYAGVTAQAYGLVAPVAEAKNDLSIKLTLGTNDAETDQDRSYETGELSKTTFTWEQGKEYIYTINISDVALEVVSVQIVPFGVGGTTNLPVQ